MNPIDFEKFVAWLEKHFEDIEISGKDIKVNSIFKEDTKKHLWCCPEKNCYRDWRFTKEENPETSGNLYKLVQLVENCSAKEARKILGEDVDASWEDLNKRVEELFLGQEINKNTKETTNLELPPSTFLISELPKGNSFRQKSEKYLNNRKISINGLYVCTSKRYYNRIVIPYYDKEKKLIYYNCRSLGNEQPKYLGPPKDSLNIGKSDVIFMPKWPPKGSKLYITEGEFDAITLWQCGLYSAALGGKNLSDYHINVFKNYQIIIALDSDDAGKQGLVSIAGENSNLDKKCSILFVKPPAGYKDWNEFYIKYNEEIVKKYIESEEKPYYLSSVLGDWKSIELIYNL